MGGQRNAVITDIAGGTFGYLDGTGFSAQFKLPRDIAADESGNLYIADVGNYCIRKITPGGVVSTLAGNGTKDWKDGPGLSASFYITSGLAIDGIGNIFVADGKLREINAAGLVTTIAGGNWGLKDGPVADAKFSNIVGVAVDSKGNIYVSEEANSCIRKITPEGMVSTFAGNGSEGFADGAGSNALFKHPAGLSVDMQDNIYVADKDNSCIRKITPGGIVTTLAGNGTPSFADGTGNNAGFNSPTDVEADLSGSIFVADNFNHRIRKISPTGMVSTVAGKGVPGYFAGTNPLESLFKYPSGIAIDKKGTVYIADSENNLIRKLE